jgi:hypothetical protein
MNYFLPYRRNNGKFTELKSARILETIRRLEQRIESRFPESGLLRVCGEFRHLSLELEPQAVQLSKPIWLVRIVAAIAAVVLMGLVLWAFAQLVLNKLTFRVNAVNDLLQSTEAAINELIFMGLALFFLITLETRLKQRTALRALHQLRSISHVVDMHQLTKDPAFVVGRMENNEVSPDRPLSKGELTRYLDYCSEMLSLVSKIAALFAQNMDDPVVLNAVNEVENLTQGLSAKIWQKIMILDLSAGKKA